MTKHLLETIDLFGLMFSEQSALPGEEGVVEHHDRREKEKKNPTNLPPEPQCLTSVTSVCWQANEAFTTTQNSTHQLDTKPQYMTLLGRTPLI